MKTQRFALAALVLAACAQKQIATLAKWPDGAFDITHHQPLGDAAYDTAIYNDSLIRYPIWHRLNDTVFAIGEDTVRSAAKFPQYDYAQLGYVGPRWHVGFDTKGPFRFRFYAEHDTDGYWRDYRIISRADSNSDWSEVWTVVDSIAERIRER
jgi:hypothetical protein